jgi:glucuronate isomerase
MQKILLDDRFFGPDESQKKIAATLFALIRELPILCPHGHVDPRLFADPAYRFGSPVELFILPDHYIFRMLYSQGIALESLGIPTIDGTPVEKDHRRIWQTFADHFHLFRATPMSVWLRHELAEVFGITRKLSSETAQEIYDALENTLKSAEFSPRRLYEKFNIEALCTTDAATDTLEHHRTIRDSGWKGRILPTFRPDSVVNIDAPGWNSSIDLLSERTGIDITSYKKFIQAIEQRRSFFKEHGCRVTDHGAYSPFTCSLSANEAESIFALARRNAATADDARAFTGNLLMENARMSVDDGLVMQLHVGCLRNHNSAVFQRFGADRGCDIPVRTEFVNNMRPLLNAYGNDPRLTLILFTMDESVYSRELAPLAGHYPSLRLGPPWWFHDSLNGMQRYFEQVMETAGLYNTAGFNDDTRALPSIPARHDVWRRSACNWLAGLVVRGIIDHEDAQEMAVDAAYSLTKKVYKLYQG